MVSMLAASAVDRGFEPRSDQTKYYNIGIWCFSAKHTALRRENKDWLPRNQNNVSEWSDMSNRGLLFQWVGTMKIHLSVLVQYKMDLIIISLQINLFPLWYSWKIAELMLNNNHSLTQVWIIIADLLIFTLIFALYSICHQVTTMTLTYHCWLITWLVFVK